MKKPRQPKPLPMGRPPVEGEVLDARVGVRLTSDEKAAASAWAEEQGIPLGTLIRAWLKEQTR